MADDANKAAKPEVAAKPEAPAKAGKKGETITVVGPVDGRWRGGTKFGPTAIVVDLAAITPAQLAAIEGDPLLSVKRA